MSENKCDSTIRSYGSPTHPLTINVTPHGMNQPKVCIRASIICPRLDTYTLVFPGTVSGGVDRAGDALGSDPNGGGTVDLVAQAFAVVDR